MKTLLLMRHARAADAKSGETDFQRVLTSDGRVMATQTGQILKSLKLRVDRIIASAALRTAETAALVAKSLSEPPANGPVQGPVDVVLERGLYHASAHEFANAASHFAFEDDSTVLIVGHNPGIGALMCYWADERLPISPATLLAFGFDVNHWSDIRANDQGAARLLAVIQDGELLRADDSIHGHSKG